MSKKVSIVVLCIDHRFWPQAIEIFKDKYEEFDLIALAGSAKNLASPTNSADMETLLENIAISIRLHHADRLILTNHIDCGAYGGSDKFQTFEQELSFHSDELRKAKTIASEKFPELDIETIFLTKSDGKIGYEQIL